MHSDSIQRPYRARALDVAATLSLIAGLLFSSPVFAQATGQKGEPLSAEELKKRSEWREAMWKLALPTKGCFQSDYPNLDWQEVKCATASLHPQVPLHGTRSDAFMHDFAARAPSGSISSAIGSFSVETNPAFPSVTLDEDGLIDKDPNTSNTHSAYTLQLNTNYFTSASCSLPPRAAPNLDCQAWQQFVFENTPTPNYGLAGPTLPVNRFIGARIYIQYWLIKYNSASSTTGSLFGLCPSGWTPFRFAFETDVYCYKNSQEMTVPLQLIQNLAFLGLKGEVTTTSDSLKFSTGSSMYTVSGDNAVDAAAGWTAVEFNVFGDGGNETGGSIAYFASEAGIYPTITPRIQLSYGATAKPICELGGFTDDSNNLVMLHLQAPASGPGRTQFFTEVYEPSNPNDPSDYDCAYATGVGDTHLTTFGGLLYDFQATGDFLLAETGPDFSVQTRQVSGAPTWPNAAVNQAVAIQSGRNQVAICLSPERLLVNGKPVPTREGVPQPLTDGGAIVRTGNVYSVRGPTGDNVRATIYGTHVDVSVGLARWPEKVTGLLANTGKGPIRSPPGTELY